MPYGTPAADPTTDPDTRRLSHPWLRIARCVPQPEDADGMVAVAVLSDEGYQQLRRRGHAHVAGACAPASRVRFVDERFAPQIRSANAASCMVLYNAPWPDLPVVVDCRTSGRQSVVALRVPPDLRALRGHFATLPLVPGVIHVAWALHFAHSGLGAPISLTGIDQLKFRRIVQPGRGLVLSVTWQPHCGSLSFQLGSQDEVHSSGRLFLGAGDA